ncbi:hypothetical protein KKF32_02300, partial [Patescibacteria group bacterium]|nr:hypothetical protein [Patescibacteria group bacterium]
MRKLSYFIPLLLFLLLTGAFYAFAAWQDPPESPPAGNTAEPLDIDAGRIQTISGGEKTILGSINISEFVKSQQFCLDTDCITAWTDVGSSLWILNGSDLYPDDLGYNVGIGTTSPAEKLEIDNTSGVSRLRITDIDATDNPELQLQYGTGDEHWALYNEKWDDSFRIWGNGADRLTILQSGDVGIGTTSPAEKLEVIGKIKGTELCIGTDCRAEWPAGAGGTLTGIGITNYIPKWTSATNLEDSQIFDDGTDIDINTDLQVVGDIKLGGTEGDITDVNMILGYDDLHLRSSDIVNNSGIYLDDSPQLISFYTGGTEKMRMDSAGNLGIGTSTPGYKLDVQNGQVNASGGLCIAGDCKLNWSEVSNLPTGTSGQTLRHDGTDWLANSVLYNDGTNISIDADLQVVGDIKLGGTEGDITDVNMILGYDDLHLRSSD